MENYDVIDNDIFLFLDDNTKSYW